MTESPGSPLSSIASDEMSDREDLKHPFSPSASTLPPSKRRRTGVASWDRNTPLSTTFQEDLPPTSPSTSISSDTSGDIPNSPTLLALIGGSQDDDYSGQGNDQVTVCRWEGCNVGDLGNMDDLVQHIHNDHVGNRQKRYSCEWSDCPRKGQTHASGYALRAHMRSHTREKPFYCALPGEHLSSSLVPACQNLHLCDANTSLQNATAVSPVQTPSPNTCEPSTRQKPSDPLTPYRKATMSQPLQWEPLPEPPSVNSSASD